MSYTLQQKKDALCKLFQYKPEDGTKNQFLQTIKTKLEQEYQSDISRIETPRLKLNRLALESLLEDERNSDITIQI